MTVEDTAALSERIADPRARRERQGDAHKLTDGVLPASLAVHPDGEGAYAVAKRDLGRGVSLLAAASLASVFAALAPHLLAVRLVGLAVLIKLHHVVPRGNVTVLAQLSAV